MALGGADEALRGRGGWDTADPDAGAFSESGPGSEASVGPERDVDIGAPLLGGGANSRRSHQWRYRTVSSLGLAPNERMSSGRAHQYPIRPTIPDGHSSDHCTLYPPAPITGDDGRTCERIECGPEPVARGRESRTAAPYRRASRCEAAAYPVLRRVVASVTLRVARRKRRPMVGLSPWIASSSPGSPDRSAFTPARRAER